MIPSHPREASVALEKYLEQLRKRFPVPADFPARIDDQRRLLREERKGMKQSGADGALGAVSESREYASFPAAEAEVVDARPTVAEQEQAVKKAYEKGRSEGAAQARAEAERANQESAAASRRDRWKQLNLEDFAERCRNAGLTDALDLVGRRLAALEALVKDGPAPEDPTRAGVRHDHDKAISHVAYAISEEFYALIGQLRIRLRAGSSAFTASDFNETGQRLAKSMNAKLFGGRALMVAEPERVAVDDALHEYASGSAGQPMQPATFRLTDGAGKTTRRAIIVPQAGGGG